MTATIHPIDFARRPAETRGGPQGARNVPGCDQPASGDATIPADLEALVASHADDLRLGSICDAVEDLIERASDERAGYAHRPMGVIADVALDGLLKVKADLAVTVRALAVRAALAEAQSLDADLADLPPAEQIAFWRELTPAQRAAVIHVQQRVMIGGEA